MMKKIMYLCLTSIGLLIPISALSQNNTIVKNESSVSVANKELLKKIEEKTEYQNIHAELINKQCIYNKQKYLLLNEPKTQIVGFQYFDFDKYQNVNMVFVLKDVVINNGLALHMKNVDYPLYASFYNQTGQYISTTFMPSLSNQLFSIPLGTKYVVETPIYNPFFTSNNTITDLNTILQKCNFN